MIRRNIVKRITELNRNLQFAAISRKPPTNGSGSVSNYCISFRFNYCAFPLRLTTVSFGFHIANFRVAYNRAHTYSKLIGHLWHHRGSYFQVVAGRTGFMFVVFGGTFTSYTELTPGGKYSKLLWFDVTLNTKLQSFWRFSFQEFKRSPLCNGTVDVGIS